MAKTPNEAKQILVARKRRQRALDALDKQINATVSSHVYDNPHYILAHYANIDDDHADWYPQYCKDGDALAQVCNEQNLVYLNCYVSEQDGDYGTAYWFLPYMLNDKPAVKYVGTDTLAMFRSLCLGQDYVLFVYNGTKYVRYMTTDEAMLRNAKSKKSRKEPKK